MRTTLRLPAKSESLTSWRDWSFRVKSGAGCPAAMAMKPPEIKNEWNFLLRRERLGRAGRSRRDPFMIADFSGRRLPDSDNIATTWRASPWTRLIRESRFARPRADCGRG